MQLGGSMNTTKLNTRRVLCYCILAIGFGIIVIAAVWIQAPRTPLNLAREQTIRDLVSALPIHDNRAHAGYSDAVQQLIDIGDPALQFVLPVLMSENEDSRMRAATVLAGVISKRFGFEFGRGWK